MTNSHHLAQGGFGLPITRPNLESSVPDACKYIQDYGGLHGAEGPYRQTRHTLHSWGEEGDTLRDFLCNAISREPLVAERELLSFVNGTDWF